MSSAGTEGPSIVAVLVKSLALAGAVTAANVGRRAASMVGGYLVVAGLFGISLCFLTFSGYRAISLAMGSIYASLIVGCVYLVAGLVATLILQARRR
jgi:hypothetical protein